MIKYTKNGSIPSSLPWRIRLTDGSTRTNPSTFTDAMIADAGFTVAPDKPDEIENKMIKWDGTNWYYVDHIEVNTDVQ